MLAPFIGLSLRSSNTQRCFAPWRRISHWVCWAFGILCALSVILLMMGLETVRPWEPFSAYIPNLIGIGVCLLVGFVAYYGVERTR